MQSSMQASSMPGAAFEADQQCDMQACPQFVMQHPGLSHTVPFSRQGCVTLSTATGRTADRVQHGAHMAYKQHRPLQHLQGASNSQASSKCAGRHRGLKCSIVQHAATMRGQQCSVRQLQQAETQNNEAIVRRSQQAEVATDLPPSLSCSAATSSTGIAVVPAHRLHTMTGGRLTDWTAALLTLCRGRACLCPTPVAAQRCAGCCVATPRADRQCRTIWCEGSQAAAVM